MSWHKDSSQKPTKKPSPYLTNAEPIPLTREKLIKKYQHIYKGERLNDFIKELLEFAAQCAKDIPKKGVWFDVVDFNEKEYSSSYGYFLWHNGILVDECPGINSRFGDAVEDAKKAKYRYTSKLK